MTEETKAKRDFAMHVNRVDLIGRVYAEVRKSPDGKVVRVPVVVPVWGRDGTQWITLALDVPEGKQMAKAAEATIGDFFTCVARFVDRQIRDDEGNLKTLSQLQVNDFHDVNIMPAEAAENPLNPQFFGICRAQAVIAGRNFLRKDAGNLPELREGANGKYCWVNVSYEDPRQEPPTDSKYFKSMFMDFALNGQTAEIASQYCRKRAQILAFCELTKKEANFTAKGGKSPVEVRLRMPPGGFHFVNLDRGGGGAKEEKPAQGYDNPEDVSGIAGLDDDIPF
jgi:hypothetical protein